MLYRTQQWHHIVMFFPAKVLKKYVFYYVHHVVFVSIMYIMLYSIMYRVLYSIYISSIWLSMFKCIHCVSRVLIAATNSSYWNPKASRDTATSSSSTNRKRHEKGVYSILHYGFFAISTSEHTRGVTDIGKVAVWWYVLCCFDVFV